MINSGKHFFDIDSSWVEFFTNAAFLQGQNSQLLANIALHGKLPGHMVWSFLHESTHHWCFDTYFGNALFALRLKSFADATTLSDQSNYSEKINGFYDLMTDQFRYECACEMIRPLSEGLAQFAEYDIIDSKTELVAPHISFAPYIFSKKKHEEVLTSDYSKMSEEFYDFLFTQRLVTGVKKKSDLLQEPLSIYGNGKYLTGYLFVKAMQSLLISRDPEFIDPNLFLCFMRGYFFNDMGFIAVLLDEDVKDENVPGALAVYFQQRIAGITKIQPGVLKEFEKNGLDRSPINKTVNIGTDDKEVKKGEILLIQLEQKVLTHINHKIFNSLIFRRRFFRTASFSVYVVIQERINVFTEKPLPKDLRNESNEFVLTFSVGNHFNVVEQEVEAIFEQFVSFDPFKRVFLIRDKNNSLLYYEFSPNWSEIEKENFLFYYDTSVKMVSQQVSEHIDLLIEQTLNQFIDYEILRPSLMQNFQSLLNDVYVDRSIYSSLEDITAIKSIMSVRGYKNILKDQSLIKLLAFLSIMTSHNYATKANIYKIGNDVRVYADDAALQELEKRLMVYQLLHLINKKNEVVTRAI